MRKQLHAIEPRLPVADLARSRAFYAEVLGFHAPDLEPGEDPNFTIVRRDAVAVQLVKADAHHPAAPFTVWIRVDDAGAEHARLAGRARVEWGPEVYEYGCREFAILDPDGHRIIFSSPESAEAQFGPADRRGR